MPTATSGVAGTAGADVEGTSASAASRRHPTEKAETVREATIRARAEGARHATRQLLCSGVGAARYAPSCYAVEWSPPHNAAALPPNRFGHVPAGFEVLS